MKFLIFSSLFLAVGVVIVLYFFMGVNGWALFLGYVLFGTAGLLVAAWFQARSRGWKRETPPSRQQK